jgi:SAM-dependent methyltransferase
MLLSRMLVVRKDLRLQAYHVDENQRFYEKRFVGAHYASQSQLQKDEQAILSRYRPLIAGKRILDLGVGGGRTTPFLLELSTDYVGVDYSREMVERCRRRFPRVEFQVVDARDLSIFPDHSFDFIFFSNNGIDSVSQEDRLTVFREVRRLLKDDGLFVFSSHNRNFKNRPPWDVRHLAINPLRRPIRFARRLASVPVGIFNYVRHVKGHVVTDEYCILVDSAHRYSLMHYRITLDRQKRQLEHMGFSPIDALGHDGRLLSDDDSEKAQDPWIQYACRKKMTASTSKPS